jgi:ribosomal-protein-alanine N-acetyltransferase
VRTVVGEALAVRPATRTDLEQIARIEQASFADPWTFDALETALGMAHIRFLVAEEGRGAGSRLVG